MIALRALMLAILLSAASTSASCYENRTERVPMHSISREQALDIARKDALHAYRDLTPYRVEATLREDGWHVDYVLKNERADGGGPHYVIDARDGHIVRKRYEQ